MGEAGVPERRVAPSAALTMILQTRAVEARVEMELKGLGLSVRRLGILGHLRSAPGISFSALARRAGIKVQSLHPIVDALMEQGLVATIGGVGQGRAAVIELTQKGHDAFAEANAVLMEIDRELFTAGEWKELGEVLVRIAEVFFRERMNAAPSAE
jgi:DNA-binding MarR family transcriptional regulator